MGWGTNISAKAAIGLSMEKDDASESVRRQLQKGEMPGEIPRFFSRKDIGIDKMGRHVSAVKFMLTDYLL